MKKRLFSIITALVLCLVLLPATALAAGTTYLDAAGNQLTCDSATAVTSDDTGWNNGWYVVQGEVTIGTAEATQRVTVSGDVHLILTDGCTLTVNGGIGVNSGNSLTIYGQSGNSGRLTATGTDDTGYNAGIGGTSNNAAGSITINGGVINATGSTGSSYGGAGIGGGWQCDGGTITINGGNVTATGGTGSSYGGAGIGGGGYGGSGGTITINGGDIRATGGKSTGYSGHSGAGIGGGGTAVNGGGSGGGGTINISGGKVEATGGAIILSGDETGNNNSGSGAGIGGGSSSSDSGEDRGSGGTITISGGTVTATGGSGNFSGAGIGSGGTSGSNGNSGGTIKISGGTVTATGGESKDVNYSGACGAGIGGGGKGDGGTVTISGGSVTATSGTANTASTYGGEGIGSGGCYKKVNGSFATTTSGNAIIKASSIGDQSGKAADAENPWSGFIYEGNDGSVYGDQTLTTDMTIDTGKTLTVPAGTALAVPAGVNLTSNGTLTSNGAVYVDGSLTGNVSGNVYYPLTLINCTASAGTSTYLGNTYAEEGATVTLTGTIPNPSNQFVKSWGVTPQTGTGNGNDYDITSMPANAVTVTANIEDALTINTQPESKTITYGEQTALSVNVSRHSFISSSTPLSYQWYKNGVEIPDTNSDSYTTPNDLAAGAYTYKCEITCGKYTVTSNTATVTVNKATVSVPTIDSKAYTGELQKADVSDTELYTVTANEGGTNAGDYDVTLTLTDPANYQWVGSEEATKTLTFTISPKDITVSITPNGGTYGDTITPASAVLLGVVNGETVDVTLTYTGTANDGTSHNSTDAPTKAGSYTVTASISNANYNLTGTVDAEFVVDKATVAVPTIDSKDYTGGTLTADVSNTDRYTVTANDGGTNAGNYDVKLTLTDANNYKWAGTEEAAKTLTFTITQATNAWNTQPTDATWQAGWVYGGTAPTDYGAPKFGTVTVSYKDADNTAHDGLPTNAGTYTVVFTVTGNGNYTALQYEIGSVTISKKSVTATVTVAEKAYDGTDTATVSAVVTTGVESGDTITISGLTGTFEDADVGVDKSVTINADGKSITGDGSGNYTVTIPDTATGTITKATNQWTTDPAVTNWTYGTPIAPAGAAQFGTVKVEYRPASSTSEDDYTEQVPTNAGSYTVRFTVAETDNYTGLTETKDLTISKKTIGITWSNTELTYNGQAQKPTAIATGLVGEDTCTITVTGEETNAGSYTATAESVDNNNYKLPTSGTTQAFTISPKSVTVEAGSYKVSKTYDGTTDAGTPTGALTVSGILSGDSGVTVNATLGAYTSPNVGGQSEMNVSLAIDGDTNNNYQLASSTVTVPCTITARPITIDTASATNRDYIEGNTSVETDVTFTDTVYTLTKDTDYTVIGEVDNADAGTGKTVNVTVTLTNANYALADNTTTTTVNIGKIAYPGTTTASGSAMYGNPGTVDLSNYLKDGYVIGTITKTNGDIFAGDPGMDGTSLKFSFANVSGNIGQTAVITVPVTSTTNYNPYSITVTVTVEAKAVPVVTAPTAVAGLTYNGTAQTLISAGSTSAGEMQYKMGNGEYSTALPTATNAGTYTVYYKVVGNSDYADVAENSLTVTIGKKEVTAAPKDVTIIWGSAIPTFELTYTGLLGDDTLTPDADPTFTCFEADGTTAVSTSTAAGTYTITWTNTDITFTGGANYQVVPETGALIISYPSYSDDDDSSSSSTTTTEKNEDGSTTTTVTDKTTGTVTETTTSQPVTDENGNTTQTVTETVTNKDGSTVETVTETVQGADGSSVETTAETKTDANGVTTSTETVKATDTTGTTAEKVTETNAAGETTTTVEATVSDQAVTQAIESGAPVKLPVEVTATTSTETAPVVSVEVPASVSAEAPAKVEIPVEKVTPGTVAVIVREDGTEEIVKATTMGENGVIVSLDGSATVKIVDNSKTFHDVAAGDWESDAVAFVSSREIFNGTGDATFDPDVDMTRGMLMTVLARFDGENTGGGETWYDKGLQWAKDNGVSDGTNPTDKLTREQMAVMLWRYAGSPDIGGQELNFPDAGNVSDFAEDAMNWAVETGLINGMNGNLNPQGYATRAQLAAILMRFCQNVAQ